MPRFISATYHASIKVAEFIAEDGRHLLRSGGTLPWRINNGGDLSSPLNSVGQPAPKKTKNYIGFARTNSGHHFFIFPDYETGRAELLASLKRKYAEKTIPEVIPQYAPKGDNNTDKYIRDVLKLSGISKDKKVSEMSASELNTLADSIEKVEGYHNDADTRQETWVGVSTITATDGARPLPHQEVVLRSGGTDTKLKSDQYGKFPAIAHNSKPIEVLHKQPDGKLKSVGTLSGEKGQHYSLLSQAARFFGISGPDTPPVVQKPTVAADIYTVQPKDTLSKIATRYKTTVATIKADNHLKTDMIFPGQVLSIGEPASQRILKPKKSPPAPPATTAAPTTRTRSKDGAGKTLAVIDPKQPRAPWMAVAFREAIEHAGEKEDVVTKTDNYHRMVTDRDRGGGEVRTLKDKHGRPLLGKDGQPLTKIKFDGSAGLVSVPWCASFVNYCLVEAGYRHGRRPESSYTFGEDTDLFVRIKKPVYGAIRFSRRVTPDGKVAGHVCLVYGLMNGKLVILGGNQGNKICFQLRDLHESGSVFYVPLPYKKFAEKTVEAELPEIDLAALSAEYGAAVAIDSAEIKTEKLNNGSDA